jgi:hypothetical protein
VKVEMSGGPFKIDTSHISVIKKADLKPANIIWSP